MRVIGIIFVLVGLLAACLFVATVSGWLDHTRWDPVFLFVISAPAAVVGLVLGFIFWIAGLIAGQQGQGQARSLNQ